MTQPNGKRAKEQSARYFPISPLLILPSARGEFEVFLKQGEKLVLYTTRGERFTEEHRRRLGEAGIARVWIKGIDRDRYDNYLTEYLGEILADESVPVSDRSSVWVEASTHMIEDVFGRDLPEQALRTKFGKLKSVVRSTAAFFTDPVALKELSLYMRKGFSSYRHGLSTMVYVTALLGTFEDLAASVVNEVAIGALLHDIGKTRLPERLIIGDPGQRTEDDEAVLRSHPALGVSVCSRLPMSQEALNCILFHHERCDGLGYPSGARRDELPVYARAVALVNVFDNLTRQTEFQRGITPFAALTAMKDEGDCFDMDLLKRFILVLSRSEIV
ncbi:MAG: HD-GYP domain-containing protein [Desulfovibrionaceae bacterium]